MLHLIFSITNYRDAGKDREELYIAEAAGFNAAGTACSPGHKFFVREKGNEHILLDEFIVTAETSIYVYDSFKNNPDSLMALTEEEMELNSLQKNNLEFGKHYLKFTGREWLSLYPRRHPPRHYMWPADYFGQEHIVKTEETHFISLPPSEELGEIKPGENRITVELNPKISWYDWIPSLFNPSPSPSTTLKAQRKVLHNFRTGEEIMNMTMKVLSCSPRVFEIKNFLSKIEVDHIMELATGMTLHTSTTKAGVDGEAREDKTTRTSKNTWVHREKSPIIDIVYRRAADLLQVDESLLRVRYADERPDYPFRSSMAEQLQLVHYDVGQQCKSD